MSITEFLLARIAEDQEAARPFPGAADLRVLRECAAKRAIIGLADEALEAEVKRRDASALGADLMHQDTLRALAAVYSDHPDYQPEWANPTASE